MPQRIEAISKQASRASGFLLAGFVLLGALILLAAWFGLRQRAGSSAALATSATERALSVTFFDVQQAESAQRGYLLTGNATYLTPYLRSRALLPGDLATLQASIGTGVSAADLAALDRAIASKMAELTQTVALAQAGNRAAAMAIVDTNSGLHDMDKIRALVIALQTAQTALLARTEAVDRRDTLLFDATALLGVLATMLLAAFAIRDNRLQTGQVLALNAELNRIFLLSTDILKVSNGAGTILNLSPAWTQITGHRVEDALGKTYRDFVHPDDLGHTAATLAQVTPEHGMLRFENRLRRTDGSYRWISWRAVPVPGEDVAYSIGRDVTEEKSREEQLRQSQKMEVIGQLTGGIAHDFNNLLTVIMGSLELLQRSLAGAEEKIQRRIEAAMDGARRATALTHRMLAFARRQPLEPQAIDPNKMVSGMSEILHRVLGEHIALEFVCAAGLWRVLADGHQLENAILNLAVNARDAMPGGGHLTIETQNMFLDDAYAAAEADVTPGQYVLIAVTDTGVGMAPDIAAKAFEPFFTTKPVGRGTGLGLAQVYGFIKQSQGHIKIYSEPGQGTTVKLYLPRLKTTEPEPVRSTVAPPEDLQAKGETILVVEDEDAVRRFTVEVLRDYGYAVLEADNAKAAMPIIRSDARIDLMFTDVVLTGELNGRQLADALLNDRPGTKVLFTTGYTRNAIIHNGRLDEGTEFLGKPFSGNALAQKIRRILDKK